MKTKKELEIEVAELKAEVEALKEAIASIVKQTMDRANQPVPPQQPILVNPQVPWPWDRPHITWNPPILRKGTALKQSAYWGVDNQAIGGLCGGASSLANHCSG